MNFSFNQLSINIFKSLEKLGFTEPTEIQSKAIPILLEKETDLVGQAQTGTGKTGAFCLPLLEKLDFDWATFEELHPLIKIKEAEIKR